MNGAQIIPQEAITVPRDMPTILLILSMFIILPITFIKHFNLLTFYTNLLDIIKMSSYVLYTIL